MANTELTPKSYTDEMIEALEEDKRIYKDLISRFKRNEEEIRKIAVRPKGLVINTIKKSVNHGM